MKLRMNACDDVNHHGTRYVVNPFTGEAEVPDHVGDVQLRVSAGATRLDLPEQPEPEGKAVMQHISDPEGRN